MPPVQKSEGRSPHSPLPFAIALFSSFFLVRAFRGHFDSSHEISVMRREAGERDPISLSSASAVPSSVAWVAT